MEESNLTQTCPYCPGGTAPGTASLHGQDSAGWAKTMPDHANNLHNINEGGTVLQTLFWLCFTSIKCSQMSQECNFVCADKGGGLRLRIFSVV